MLYLVRMDVTIPTTLSKDEAQSIKAAEKTYSQQLQKDGQWIHLWRVVGQYANYSLFDLESNDHLHHILSTLPLFPYMAIDVIPLAKHPSSIH